MHIVGTAGHVDHGKSALVRALTGTDPDRLPEERRRGMTVDLGFAHLRFDDGIEAGIIDVPGHERYLRNMLAGAAGMELLLLVVAANEGVRPQTVEHLAMLDFLSVRHAIVVLTKSDLADDAMLAAAGEDVRRATRGTIAHDAALLPVSSLTGAGLGALRDAMHRALAALPPRSPDAPAFLPVDRVFSLPGHGTIVTGTLMQGTLRAGDTLRLTPPDRAVRMRSLQVFGVAREAVTAGARVAVNVPGVDQNELQRGAVLADSNFAAERRLRLRFRVLPAARGLLRRRTLVRAAIGAAEILAILELDPLPHDAAPVDAVLRLRAAVVTYPGQPLIVRCASPMVLLGGGTIVGSALAAAGQAAGEGEAVSKALAAAGLAGASPAQLAAQANLRLEHVEAMVAQLVASGAARRLTQPLGYVDERIAAPFSARIAAALARRESDAPWLLGATLQALARELLLDEPSLLRVLRAEVEARRIDTRGGYYFRCGYVPQLSDPQRLFFDAAVGTNGAASLLPAALADLTAALRSARVPGLAQAFETLLAGGALVKVGSDLYSAAQIAEIRSRLEGAIRSDGPMTMARFRDTIGTTRKYAVPLLEWFDANGVTVRVGDLRALRSQR